MLRLTARCSLSLSLILAVAAGCSTTPQMNYSKVDLVAVSGTVTLDGEPLVNAVVTFESTTDGTYSFAQTDSSGYYSLQFDSVKDGVSPGTKKVEFSTTRKILGLNTDDEGGDGESGEAGEGSAESDSPDPSVEWVPECYNKDSKLQVEVTSQTSTFNFDLKSDCSTTGATP